MKTIFTVVSITICAFTVTACNQPESISSSSGIHGDIESCADALNTSHCIENMLSDREVTSNVLLQELGLLKDAFEGDPNIRSAHQGWSDCMYENTNFMAESPDDLHKIIARQIESDAKQSLNQNYKYLAATVEHCSDKTELGKIYLSSLTSHLSVAFANNSGSIQALQSAGLISEAIGPSTESNQRSDNSIVFLPRAKDAILRATKVVIPEGLTIPESNSFQRSTFGNKMTKLNGLVFNLSYTSWKWYAANDSANGRRWYPDFHWGVTECSAPLIGNGPWDFKYACIRHDLSWANLKRIESDHSRDAWNGRNKNAADLQFREDLYARCGDFSWYVEWACYPDAELYFAAVNVLPPYALPWDAHKQGFVW